MVCFVGNQQFKISDYIHDLHYEEDFEESDDDEIIMYSHKLNKYDIMFIIVLLIALFFTLHLIEQHYRYNSRYH